jgi:AcrR family transcriptional regulator
VTTHSTAWPADGNSRPLRRDAELNRLRIVSAARAVFSEQGLEAPLAEVARRADVGVATLFRRFPTRDDLITATFAEKMRAYSDAIDDALRDPDPWHAFCSYIERVCGMQAADRGFTHVLTQTFPTAKAFEAERTRALRGFKELIARAKSAGALRTDFVPEDLPMLLMANAGVISGAGDAAPGTWRRLVAYLIQAFAANAEAPLPPAPSPRRMYRALLRLHSGESDKH